MKQIFCHLIDLFYYLKRFDEIHSSVLALKSKICSFYRLQTINTENMQFNLHLSFFLCIFTLPFLLVYILYE